MTRSQKTNYQPPRAEQIPLQETFHALMGSIQGEENIGKLENNNYEFFNDEDNF